MIPSGPFGPIVCAARGWYEQAVPENARGVMSTGSAWFSRPEKNAEGKMMPGSVHVMNFVSAMMKRELWDAIGDDVKAVRRAERGEDGERDGPGAVDPFEVLMDGGGGGGEGTGDQGPGTGDQNAHATDSDPGRWSPVAGASSPGARRIYFPEDVPTWYLDELNAEAEAVKTVKGRAKRGWFLRAAGRANHALDCRCMNLAAAAAWKVGGGGGVVAVGVVGGRDQGIKGSGDRGIGGKGTSDQGPVTGRSAQGLPVGGAGSPVPDAGLKAVEEVVRRGKRWV